MQVSNLTTKYLYCYLNTQNKFKKSEIIRTDLPGFNEIFVAITINPQMIISTESCHCVGIITGTIRAQIDERGPLVSVNVGSSV